MKDYYLRVEFQAHGAPHVHCLLWLHEQFLDKETNSMKDKTLKTMFSTEDDNENQNEINNKIDECSKNLICASITDIMCGICEQTEIIHSYEKTYGNESVTEPKNM